MFPTIQEIKLSELQQEQKFLDELKEKISELEKFKKFPETKNLLLSSKFTLEKRDKNFIIIESILKIDAYIQLLTRPIQNKINQLEYVIKLIKKYFDQSEINEINKNLSDYIDDLKEVLFFSEINPDDVNNAVIKVEENKYFAEKLIKIRIKMHDYMQNKKVVHNYEEYKLEILKRLNEKEEISEQENINTLFENIELLEESILKFEESYTEFMPRLEWLNLYESRFNSEKLVKSGVIPEIKLETEDLIGNLKLYNPMESDFVILDNKLHSLYRKLNELHELNEVEYKELKKQQKELILLIEVSGKNLNEHAETLSQAGMYSAKAKYQEITLIHERIDLLLNMAKNQEVEVSGQELANHISELKQVIGEAKDILSKYRGISFLRCFATLWGGGKVKSVPLVNELEGQLTLLQQNINIMSPKH